jgi:hypothetical protein
VINFNNFSTQTRSNILTTNIIKKNPFIFVICRHGVKRPKNSLFSFAHLHTKYDCFLFIDCKNCLSQTQNWQMWYQSFARNKIYKKKSWNGKKLGNWWRNSLEKVKLAFLQNFTTSIRDLTKKNQTSHSNLMGVK